MIWSIAQKVQFGILERKTKKLLEVVLEKCILIASVIVL